MSAIYFYHLGRNFPSRLRILCGFLILMEKNKRCESVSLHKECRSYPKNMTLDRKTNDEAYEYWQN